MVNFDGLAQFVRRSAPMVLREVNKSVASWRKLDAMVDLWQQGHRQPDIVHRFGSDHVLALQQSDRKREKLQLIVSRVAWNCSGSVMAVAYAAAEQVIRSAIY